MPQFNALQNITLGLPKATRFGLLDWRATRRQAERVAAADRHRLSPRHADRASEHRRSLAGDHRQGADAPRPDDRHGRAHGLALRQGGRSDLPDHSRGLKADGVGILYVSHRLDEILELSDRVTTFRDGLKAMEAPRAGLTRRRLGARHRRRSIVRAGRRRHPVAPRPCRGASWLSLARSAGAAGRCAASPSISVEGEVLALAGLVGAGRTETRQDDLRRPISPTSGADPSARPEVPAPRSPAEAVQAGVALVPEERRALGPRPRPLCRPQCQSRLARRGEPLAGPASLQPRRGRSARPGRSASASASSIRACAARSTRCPAAISRRS